MELEGFRENYERFQALGAGVLGISVESDRAHTAFARQTQVQFPLVSDFNREVVRQFGIEYTPDEAYTGWHGMSRRSVFVIDRDGVIRYVWISDDPLVAPDVDAVLRAVESLRGQES